MWEFKTGKKCLLGFNEDRAMPKTRSNIKKMENLIQNPVPFTAKNKKILCILKPTLTKSDREDLGYYYKKDKLYNLNHSEVPVCIFCRHYE
jgi:hypothetical protein